MDDISFDDVPFEKDTEASAAPADISFDDVPMEEPAAALPVGPRVGERVPISAREPRGPVRRVSIAEREPAEPDRSSALGDLAAGVKQAQQVIPGLQVAKGALDINEAEYEQARTESSKQRLSALDTALAELASIVGPGAVRTRPKSQAEADARERMRGAYQDLMAQRQQLLLGIGSGDPTANIQSDLTRAQEEKQSAIKSVVEGAMEINRLSEDIAKIPINRQSEIFTQSYGDTTGEKLRSMWAALSSDPTGVARTFALRSMPASAPTIIASIVGGLGGPGGAAALAGLTGGSVEAGSSMAGYITDELQKKGIDPSNRAAVEKWAVENIDTVLDMVGKSAVRAGVIGVADAATGGASEAIARAVTGAGSSRIRQAVGTGVGGVVDALGEGVGEAAAQYATEGEINQGEVGAEIVGGIPQGAATTGGQIIRQRIVGDEFVVTNDRSGGPDTEAALRATGTGTGTGTPPAASPAASTVDPDQAAAIAATQPPPAPTPAPPPAPPPVAPAAPPPPAPAPPPPAPAPPPVAPIGPAAGPTQAPPAPATPTQAQRIREIALARQAAQQAVTAPPPEAGVAEGPQAGGPPAAPTIPVTPTGKPPKEPKAPPAPARVRNFNTQSGPDILYAAGLGTGDIAAMKKGEQGRLTGIIRSALNDRFTPEELNMMPREQYKEAVKAVYDEYKAATAKPVAPPRAAAPRPAPVLETPPITEAPVAEAPVAEVPVTPPSITEAPSEGKITRGSEVSAEEKARMIAEMNERMKPKVTASPVDAPVRTLEVSEEAPLTADEIADGETKPFPKQPSKGEKIVEISQGRTGRVFQDISAEGEAAKAQVEAKAKAVANKVAAEAKAADDARDKLEAGPQGAKMNPVEVARRAANKTTATEIVKEFAPDTKTESDFENNEKAREYIWARAKRMMAAVDKRMAADDKGYKLPRRKKGSAKEEQNQQTAEILLLKAAEALSKKKTPTAKAVAEFKSAEALLRAGDIKAYMDAVKGDADTANRVAPVIQTEEGESIDAAQTLADDRASPEKRLEQEQEAEPEATFDTDWAELLDPMSQNTVTSRLTGRSYSAALEVGSGGERILVSERLPDGEFRSIGRFRKMEDAAAAVAIEDQQVAPAPRKSAEKKSDEPSVTIGRAKAPPTVVVTRTGKIDRAKIEANKKQLTRTGQPRSEIPDRRDDPGVFKSKNPKVSKGSKRIEELGIEIDKLNEQIEALYANGSSEGFIDFDAVDKLDKQRTQLQLEQNSIDSAAPLEKPFEEFSYAQKIYNKLWNRKGRQPIEAKYATDHGTFREMLGRLTAYNMEDAARFWKFDFSYSAPQMQRQVIPHILDQLNNVIGDIEVYVIPDADMDAMHGADAGAVYSFGSTADFIAIRESSFDNPKVFIHHLTHEGTHAALIAALRENPLAVKQLSEIAASVDEQMNEGDYGFTDIDEFLAEFLSNPDFAAKVAGTPVSPKVFDALRIPAPGGKSNNVLNLLRRLVAKIFNLPAFTKNFAKDDRSAYDATMAIVDSLLDTAPAVRAKFNAMTSAADRNKYIQDTADAFNDYNWMHLGNYLPYQNTPKERARAKYENIGRRGTTANIAKDKKPLSNYNQLRAGGVPNDVAREINDFLKAEMGKTVDPATVPLLIADYITQFGQPKATSAGNASTGGVQPPYQPPPTPGMGPGSPAKPQPLPFKGFDSKWRRRLGRFAIKNMTLDFMRQKYSDLFVDGKGSILKQIVEALQKRDNLALDFAAPINKITAEFTDLMKSSPKEAMELADLAMEATRLDVRLGKNADNSHLGKNKAKGLQGKKRLADLNQRFENNLSDKGRDIYTRLTAAYRDAHNTNIEALVYNILSELPQKLSTGDVMHLMRKAVSGTLDASDAAMVNDPIIFNGLKNAQGLKTIKGDYFPQMRFGDWVVRTTEVLTDPKWTSVPSKIGKKKTINLPVKTEVDGNALRIIVDPTVRGTQTAAMRALREYAEKQDLNLLGISTQYRDRQTGKMVAKGDQLIGRIYDTVYEARFQTEGVHFFDSDTDAYKFQTTSGSNVTSEVLTRAQLDERSLPDGSALGTIVKRINSDPRLSAGEKKLFDNVVRNAIIASMDGNSARSRNMARRNVQGASKDIARAAVTYGQAAGNFNATLQTAPEIRDGLQRLEQFTSENSSKAGGGQISDIAQEIRERMTTVEANREPWRLMQNIATLSFLDKLLTPSHSIVNGLQPAGTTMPVLAGRYGLGKATVALSNAYKKAGTIGATVSGVKNSATALKDIGRTAIDTEDVIGSMKKNLGKEYEALIDRMLELGAVSPDAGQEVAAVIEAAGGPITNAIGRVDRFARQLPNTIEAINRVVTAVATYDLAMGQKGKNLTTGKMVPMYTKQEAIQQAIDTVFNTQGDYRKKNAPRWMQHPGLSWALQFKKYGQMMYQLTVDMWHRSFKAATPQERAIARKQLAYLYLTQASMAGVFGLSGLEILKVGVQALSLLGLPTWEEEEDEARKWIEENTVWPVSSVINNGLLSTVTQLDFAGRLGQADMALGFLPKDMGKTDIYQFFGQVLAGAPGGTVVDWTQAAKAFAEGDWVKGLELSIPIKQVSDLVGAGKGVAEGKLGPYEAASKFVGFRSLETANERRQTGMDIRDFKQRKKIEKGLYDNLREALANKDRAAEFKARQELRKYRKELERQRKLEKE